MLLPSRLNLFSHGILLPVVHFSSSLLSFSHQFPAAIDSLPQSLVIRFYQSPIDYQWRRVEVHHGKMVGLQLERGGFRKVVGLISSAGLLENKIYTIFYHNSNINIC